MDKISAFGKNFRYEVRKEQAVIFGIEAAALLLGGCRDS
jgi:hypothetical protein